MASPTAPGAAVAPVQGEKALQALQALKEALKEAGVPDDQLMQAYYLQILRDKDRAGAPFVPGPIPGTGVGAVPSNK